MTAAVGVGLLRLARRWSMAAALAISVHAMAPLAAQQVLATPLHYWRESLTSPTNLAVFLPVEDGSFAARLLGGIDIFALWWLWLLAPSLAAATGRRPAPMPRCWGHLSGRDWRGRGGVGRRRGS